MGSRKFLRLFLWRVFSITHESGLRLPTTNSALYYAGPFSVLPVLPNVVGAIELPASLVPAGALYEDTELDTWVSSEDYVAGDYLVCPDVPVPETEGGVVNPFYDATDAVYGDAGAYFVGPYSLSPVNAAATFADFFYDFGPIHNTLYHDAGEPDYSDQTYCVGPICSRKAVAALDYEWLAAVVAETIGVAEDAEWLYGGGMWKLADPGLFVTGSPFVVGPCWGCETHSFWMDAAGDHDPQHVDALSEGEVSSFDWLSPDEPTLVGPASWTKQTTALSLTSLRLPVFGCEYDELWRSSTAFAVPVVGPLLEIPVLDLWYFEWVFENDLYDDDAEGGVVVVGEWGPVLHLAGGFLPSNRGGWPGSALASTDVFLDRFRYADPDYPALAGPASDIPAPLAPSEFVYAGIPVDAAYSWPPLVGTAYLSLLFESTVVGLGNETGFGDNEAVLEDSTDAADDGECETGEDLAVGDEDVASSLVVEGVFQHFALFETGVAKDALQASPVPLTAEDFHTGNTLEFLASPVGSKLAFALWTNIGSAIRKTIFAFRADTAISTMTRLAVEQEAGYRPSDRSRKNPPRLVFSFRRAWDILPSEAWFAPNRPKGVLAAGLSRAEFGELSRETLFYYLVLQLLSFIPEMSFHKLSLPIHLGVNAEIGAVQTPQFKRQWLAEVLVSTVAGWTPPKLLAMRPFVSAEAVDWLTIPQAGAGFGGLFRDLLLFLGVFWASTNAGVLARTLVKYHVQMFWAAILPPGAFEREVIWAVRSVLKAEWDGREVVCPPHASEKPATLKIDGNLVAIRTRCELQRLLAAKFFFYVSYHYEEQGNLQEQLAEQKALVPVVKKELEHEPLNYLQARADAGPFVGTGVRALLTETTAFPQKVPATTVPPGLVQHPQRPLFMRERILATWRRKRLKPTAALSRFLFNVWEGEFATTFADLRARLFVGNFDPYPVLPNKWFRFHYAGWYRRHRLKEFPTTPWFQGSRRELLRLVIRYCTDKIPTWWYNQNRPYLTEMVRKFRIGTTAQRGHRIDPRDILNAFIFGHAFTDADCGLKIIHAFRHFWTCTVYLTNYGENELLKQFVIELVTDNFVRQNYAACMKLWYWAYLAQGQHPLVFRNSDRYHDTKPFVPGGHYGGFIIRLYRSMLAELLYEDILRYIATPITKNFYFFSRFTKFSRFGIEPPYAVRGVARRAVIKPAQYAPPTEVENRTGRVEWMPGLTSLGLPTKAARISYVSIFGRSPRRKGAVLCPIHRLNARRRPTLHRWRYEPADGFFGTTLESVE